MCTSPISIKVQNDYRQVRNMLVPCGKCAECLRDYQNAWYVRFVQEFSEDYRAVFFTLTYSPKSIPTVVDTNTGAMAYSVCRSHVQDWIKRFRTWYEREHGEKIKMKYFITAEYGPNTGRPHYHGVIFHQSAKDLYHLFRDWQTRFGFVKYDDVYWDNPFGACKYVSKYCNKGFFENKFVSEGFVQKVFHLVSKRLGFNYVLARRDWHLLRGVYHVPHFDYCLKGIRWSLDYLRSVASRKSITLVDKRGEVTFKMPKYYADRIYSDMKVYVNDKGQTIYEFSRNFLRSALSDFICKKNDALYVSQLAAIQAARHCSEVEAVHIYNREMDKQIRTRKNQAESSMREFYQRSIF